MTFAGAKRSAWTCGRCAGSGSILVGGWEVPIYEPCPDCHGGLQYSRHCDGPGVRQAVSLANSESLIERLTEPDERQRDAIDRAEREWAGKPRLCPKCGSEFKSVRDRGQCTNCSHIFYASHPETGNAKWWLEIM